MKTNQEIIKEIGIEYSDLISSSTMGAIEKAMDEARKEALQQSGVMRSLSLKELNDALITLEKKMNEDIIEFVRLRQ